MNNTTELRTFLNSHRSEVEYFTHVAMGDFCGKFMIGRKDEDALFAILGKGQFVCGLAERPQQFSMFRVDWDMKEVGTKVKPLHTEKDIENIVKEIQLTIKKIMRSDMDPKLMDCLVLTKKPYISGEYVKHGFHLQFPNLFIEKPVFETIELYLKNIYPNFDKISSHPWLTYNCCKKASSGQYKADYVITHAGKVVKPSEYFLTYKIYNTREKEIEITPKNVESLYPRILSIVLRNRMCVYGLKPEILIPKGANKLKEQKSFAEIQELDEETEKYSDKIEDVIDGYLLEGGYSLSFQEHNGSCFKYKNIGGWTCPVSGDEHSRIGSYFFIIPSAGKIAHACYKCRDTDGKNYAIIGSYKQVEKKEYSQEEKMKEYTAKNINYLFSRTLPTQFKTEIKDKCFISDRPEVFSGKERCSVIRAGLGMGKSKAVENYINETKYESVYVFTPRRSYARSCFNRMKENCSSKEWSLYLDEKKYLLSHPNIIIQAESLHRLPYEVPDNCLVVIDEVEAFLTQLTSTKTHREKHVENIEAFENIMKKAKKIICLDAFVSKKTLDTMSIMEVDYHLYDFTAKLNKRRAIPVEKREVLREKIASEVENGKKIFFFCSSVKKLQGYFLPYLKERLPNKKILVYSSVSVKNIEHVNTEWADADIVITTSTITVGINFDIKNHFNKIFCYASSCSKNYVRDIFQSLYRVRHITDDELYFHIDSRHYGISLSTWYKQIKDEVLRKINLIEGQYKTQYDCEYPYKTPEWLLSLAIYNKFEHNVSIMNITDMFYRYLEECNYEVSEDLTEEIDMFEFKVEEKVKIPYNQIPELTSSQMKILRTKRLTQELTDMETAQMEKFFFQHCVLDIPADLEEPIWDIYCDYNKEKFRNLMVEKGINEGKLEIKDIVRRGNFSGLESSHSVQAEFIEKIKGWLGITNTQEYGKSIPRETVEKALEKFRQNRKDINTAFDLRDRASDEFDLKNTIQFLNKILAKWGLSVIKAGKRQQRKVNGKSVDVSPFNISYPDEEKPIDVYQYIKPKEGCKNKGILIWKD